MRDLSAVAKFLLLLLYFKFYYYYYYLHSSSPRFHPPSSPMSEPHPCPQPAISAPLSDDYVPNRPNPEISEKYQ